MAERFFASLECDLLDRRSLNAKTAARLALFANIAGWYNPRRRHSGLGRIAATEFESFYAAQPPATEEPEIATEPG